MRSSSFEIAPTGSPSASRLCAPPSSAPSVSDAPSRKSFMFATGMCKSCSTTCFTASIVVSGRNDRLCAKPSGRMTKRIETSVGSGAAPSAAGAGASAAGASAVGAAASAAGVAASADGAAAASSAAGAAAPRFSAAALRPSLPRFTF